MDTYIDTKSGLLLASWSSKNPLMEKAMHDIGGSFEDFNTYRFPLELSFAGKISKAAKRFGDVKLTDEGRAALMELREQMASAKELNGSNSDAEIPALLLEEYPRTARALRSYQRAAVEFMRTRPSVLLADQPGSGKAQPLSEPVLTPRGWTVMGDIKAGDQVVGSDGLPKDVLKVFPQGQREIAVVTFSDGVKVRCDLDHLWTVQTKHQRNISGTSWTKTTRELIEEGVTYKSDGRAIYSTPRLSPVQYAPRNGFCIDPYTWGVLIGDGSLSDTYVAGITTDHELVGSLILPEGASAKLLQDKGFYGDYRLNGLSRFLRERGLNGTRAEEKSVPEEIMLGSISDRQAFLQGLLDTDGGTAPARSGGPSSTVEYGTVSSLLAEQVLELVRSLGGTAMIRTKTPSFTYRGEKREGQIFYRMNIQLPQGMSPFRLKRKLAKWTPRDKYPTTRYIRSVELTGEKEEAQCILIDSPDHLYVTTGFILTHNTLMTIASIIAAGVEGDILVLAPSIAVQAAWPGELERWAPNDEVLRVTGGRAAREATLKKLKFKPTSPRRWVLCNIEMAKVIYHKEALREDGSVAKSHYEYKYPELFFYDDEKRKNKRPWNAVVVDESHRALVTNKAQHYKQTQTRCGLSKLTVADNGKRYALTGTPFRGKLENMWGTLNWLFPKTYTSYWSWVERWFDTSSDYFGGTSVTEVKPHLKHSFYEALAPFMLRRTKREIAPDLPPKVYAGTIPKGVDFEPGQERGLVGHWLDMPPKQKKAYQQMVETATANLDNGTLVANGVLAELTRLKQFASCYGSLEIVEDVDGFEIPKFVPELPSNKFNWLLEFLEELGIMKDTLATGPESQKVIVASQFTSVIELYAKALEKKGIETLQITGKVKREDRESAVKVFQTDTGPQVLLLNTIAGGVALTLDRADDLVILDETFIPDDQEQVEDRIHRVSRNHNVTIHYVRSLGTVEERIARVTFGRDDLQKQLLDGERGVDFARKIIE